VSRPIQAGELKAGHWPPPGGEYVTATVTYSDVRGAGTWRRSTSATLRRAKDQPESPPFAISFLPGGEEDEVQLAPRPSNGTDDAAPPTLVGWLRSVFTQWKR
jgi:hypothetical protein